MQKILLIIMLSVFYIPLSNAEIPTDLQSELQNNLDNYLKKEGKKEDATAIAVSIFVPEKKSSREGEIYNLYAGVNGLPPFNSPVTANNLMQIGSITKSFTAAIILQLEAEGKLSIKDTVGKWLPQYSNWKKVTIEQLLNMTSRIPSYSTDKDFIRKLTGSNFKMSFTDKELLQYANPEKRLPKKVANNYEYSNSNYILASQIIEEAVNKGQVIHQTFPEILAARILKPFGLKNSFYPIGSKAKTIQHQIMPRMTHGYWYNPEKNEVVDITKFGLSWGGAAGAIIADTPDVLRWVQILYHGDIFPQKGRKKALKELKSIVSVTTGLPIKTSKINSNNLGGFGLGVLYYYDEKTHNRFWAYEGSTLGFRFKYIWSSCNNITAGVVLNSKAGEGDPSSPKGDEISRFAVDLYQTVIDKNPTYKCTN